MYWLFMLMQPILIYANVLFTGFLLRHFVCVPMQFIKSHVKFNLFINQMYNSAVHYISVDGLYICRVMEQVYL